MVKNSIYKLILNYSYVIFLCISTNSCDQNNEKKNIIGAWNFHDKNQIYVELEIKKDKIYWWDEYEGYKGARNHFITNSILNLKLPSLNPSSGDSIYKWNLSFINKNILLISYTDYKIIPNSSKSFDTLTSEVEYQAYRILDDEFTFFDVKEWGKINGQGKYIFTKDEITFSKAVKSRIIELKKKQGLYKPQTEEDRKKSTVIID